MEDLAPRIKEVRAQQKELEDKRNELLDGKNEDAPRTWIRQDTGICG